MVIDRTEARIRTIHQNLLDEYGAPEDPAEMSGVDYLIETILSQNTNDEARDEAFDTLLAKYDSYEDIENAPTDAVADAIRVCGLGPTKAKRIQGALQRVRQRTGGEYDMGFINDMSVDEAMDWLTGINGVGPKTAALILCFHFQKPIMPVDTHVERLSKRFELVPHSASAPETQRLLNEAVPDNIKYSFHMLLIEHGRAVCSARNPNCGDTKLRTHCSYYRQVLDGDVSPDDYPTDMG